MSTIENLDEDCLIEIFSYLNICDRQCAEQGEQIYFYLSVILIIYLLYY